MTQTIEVRKETIPKGRKELSLKEPPLYTVMLRAVTPSFGISVTIGHDFLMRLAEQFNLTPEQMATNLKKVLCYNSQVAIATYTKEIAPLKAEAANTTVRQYKHSVPVYSYKPVEFFVL